LLHLFGDDGEAASRLARARGFNRGVEREQVRLKRDLVDHLDHLADALRMLAHRAYLVGSHADFAAHLVDDQRRALHRLRLLLDPARDGLHALVERARRLGSVVNLRRLVRRRARHLLDRRGNLVHRQLRLVGRLLEVGRCLQDVVAGANRRVNRVGEQAAHLT
jgi:hypothetical protein